jgi:hypothetical protein
MGGIPAHITLYGSNFWAGRAMTVAGPVVDRLLIRYAVADILPIEPDSLARGADQRVT